MTPESANSHVSHNEQLLERARNVIRELRERLVAAEALSKPAPIAIVGMACDFPGVRTDLEAFWQMTVDGRDAVCMIPPDRWDRDALYAAHAPTAGKMNTLQAAFLGDVARFDAAFFDVPPIEAVRMDPQQRIFLETAWHAIEDAGLSREALSGSETGVFVGVHSQSMDYYALQAADIDSLDAYAATGTAQDVIAGRLAYWLNLQGPSMAINTACSSSLVALHLACRSLRAGDCNAAIAGGVNLLLSPTTSVAASQLQMLASDGRCKAFDSRADGFGRGEGCGVVILKRLYEAERDGDRILAVIRGSAINQDGRTNGLTAPNGLAQQRLLRRALENAGVSSSQVGYVETHGTGTTLGDPIEVEALAEVLGSTSRTFSCALGSVKANIGHLEGAAGIAGVIKAILVLRNKYIPPVANLQILNPHLPVEGSALNIPLQGRPWTSEATRIAGVSSFGWSGTNAHFILEEAPDKLPALPTQHVLGQRQVMVAVSAQSVEALRILALAYADRLEKIEDRELYDIGFTSTFRRTHHPYRLAAVGSNGYQIASVIRVKAAKLTRDLSALTMPIDVVGSSSDLEKIVQLYENGGDVDWKGINPVAGATVQLPRYPFQGKRYWLTGPAANRQSDPNAVAPDNWFYRVEWSKQPLVSDLNPICSDRALIILDDAFEFGDKLLESVRRSGYRAMHVCRGESSAKISSDQYKVQANSVAGVGRLLELLSEEGISTANIVYVAGVRNAQNMVKDALLTAQAILKSKIDAKLWFVTRGGQSVSEDFSRIEEGHAALWGFSRVLGLESPDICGAVIDISQDVNDSDVRAVINEVIHSDGEDRVAYREGQRWVPRLKRIETSALSKTKFAIRQDGCYLITGAFGNLGMQLAEWLVELGVRNLELVGRRSPDDMNRPDLLDRLETMKAKGVAIHLRIYDIGEASLVDGLFRDIERGGLRLSGVIHAAASIEFGTIAESSEQDIARIFRAKVDGARLLDVHTRKHSLDFFVTFSSAAVSIGARNASIYAAANSCLSGIAEERQNKGFPALNVEWGLWEDSAAIEQRELIARSGFLPMQPTKALEALGRLIASGESTPIVAAIDWLTLGPALEMRGHGAFVSEVVNDMAFAARSVEESEIVSNTSAASSDKTNSSRILEEISVASEHNRFDLLLKFVSREAKVVFGISPEDILDETRGLFQMGMNSLMSVDLKKRLEAGLGVKLPGTLTLSYPTITALAGYLEERLFPRGQEASASLDSQAGSGHDSKKSPDEELVFIASMDDSETDAAIAAELAAIQQKLGAY
jgi:acyl transferase domain-containing protein/acyl carrier protein